MKLKNRNTNVVKEVDEVTGALMVGTKEWEVYEEKEKKAVISRKLEIQMNLSVDNIQHEIKQIGKLRNIHKEPRFLEFIARKCMEVLREETEAARSKSPYGNISKEYAESHTYETFISGLSSIVVLSNEAKNQFGEYISRYIEYGTGMYNAESTAPDGFCHRRRHIRG